MGLHPEELDEHARLILGSRRILRRVVVLCEGERSAPADRDRRPSPQTYRRQEHWPDSNFYRRCVPLRWRERPPQFFNCGDRLDVLQTFARVQELHQEDPAGSYLDPGKLHALVDLDLQPADLENSPCPTTEDLHEALYEHAMLRTPVDEGHRIWVTALIHKEAYFLLPSMEPAFDRQPYRPHVDGRPLDLADFCQSAAGCLDPDGPTPDRDLLTHFDFVRQRLSGFEGLDVSSPAALCRSWRAAFDAARPSKPRMEHLARALFLTTHAKPHWHRIEPPSDGTYTSTAAHYRGQLALAVGEHIASLPPEAHPIAGFIEHLHARR